MLLQYELAFRSILWYLKIYNEESDPVLTQQLRQFRNNDTLKHSCFYRLCHAYIEKLSGSGGVNLFDCEPSQRKHAVRSAMFLELNEYWQGLSESRTLRQIHPEWEEQRLSSVMLTRYTHCLMHNLALGRGPLRCVIHRKKPELQLCRHGCGEKEDLHHVLFKCKKLNYFRKGWRKQCEIIEKDMNTKTLMRATELREEVERGLKRFFT